MPATPRRNAASPIALAAFAVIGLALAALSVGALGAEPTGEVAAITGTPAISTSPEPTASPRPTSSPTPDPTPTPTPVPTPTPTPIPTPVPTPKPVLSMNLYHKGDFVSQATKEQCVSAAMQIMLNIIRPKNDGSKAFQARLADLAQELSDASNGGTEPRGWARGLERLGGGKYEVAIAPTRGKAIERAVRAMRATGRPVGLLVWRGAHSWVLHGFEATADPAGPGPMTVKYIYVSDPWYPRISSIWGASRGPNARITPKQLEEDYLPWRRPTGKYPGMDGQYVLILPVAD